MFLFATFLCQEHAPSQVYMDGLLNTRSAVMKSDYLRGDPDLGDGSTRGVHYFTQQRLTNYLSQLQSGLGSDGAG